jgi:hypothetical protein
VLPFRIFSWGFNACPPLLLGRGAAALRARRMFPGCDEFMRRAAETIVPQFAAVALGGMWHHYGPLFPEFEELLFETALALAARNHTVIILAQV